MPVLRKTPPKLFEKYVLKKGYGFNTPQDGSLCKVKILSDEANIFTNNCCLREIIVGDVDDPLECILDDCIRCMKDEEECCVILNFDCEISRGKDVLKDINGGREDSCKCKNNHESKNSSSSSKEVVSCNSSDKIDSLSSVIKLASVVVKDNKCERNQFALSSRCTNSPNELMMQLQLLSYTREPEIWEMSITEKWRRASYHKQRGLELYDHGVYQYAFRRFGLTLKYVISLEHDVPSGQEEGMDIKGLKLSCYLNVAACQMRHNNFESVILNSSRALMLQTYNAKAFYRRGSAYFRLQQYEKAKADLTAAHLLEPKNQAILKQLQLL